MKRFATCLIFTLFLAFPVLAATTDFTADGNITVNGVTFGSGTADMLIMTGSTAESWSFSAGIFTITNPDATAGFKVGTSDSSVKSVKVKNSAGSTVACGENTVPGTSYAVLPTVADIYTIEPSDLVDCETLCTVLTGAATYNAYPTCGAATCNGGYSLSGSGASAVCSAVSGAGVAVLQGMNSSPAPSGTSSNTTTTSPETNSSTEANSGSTSQESANSENTSAVKTVLNDSDFTADSQPIAEYNSFVAMDKDASAAYEKVVTDSNFSKTLNTEDKYSLANFIQNGTALTKTLGIGERAGVINSFASAFGKLPSTQTDWSDTVKIANGRWPSQRDAATELNASKAFKKIYLRDPNRKDPHDDAAVTVISYGLRPSQRNLNSEKQAIKSFRYIYGYDPKSANAWDIVRAIAYSGSKR